MWQKIVESETRSERGCYSWRVTLVQRLPAPCPDHPFSTHVEVDGPNGPENQAGHYDLTLTEACADFQERCKAHGVDLGEAFGPEIKTFAKR